MTFALVGIIKISFIVDKYSERVVCVQKFRAIGIVDVN